MKAQIVQDDHNAKTFDSAEGLKREARKKPEKEERFHDVFPFLRDLKEYPITRKNQYPPMPIKLICVEADLHFCFEMLSSNGSLYGGKESPTNLRLDAITIDEIGGFVSDTKNYKGTNFWEKASGIDKTNDGSFNISLVPDGTHPFELPPFALCEYIRKIQKIYLRSTTPREARNLGFDEI